MSTRAGSSGSPAPAGGACPPATPSTAPPRCSPACSTSRLDEIGHRRRGAVPDATGSRSRRSTTPSCAARSRAPATGTTRRRYADYADRLAARRASSRRTRPRRRSPSSTTRSASSGSSRCSSAGSSSRAAPGHDGARAARWVDGLGHDSAYDYDPVWAALRRARRVAHVPLGGHRASGSRMSPTNYVVQPHRQLRRRQRGDLPVAVLRRRAARASRSCASRSSKAAWRGRRSCYADAARPLGEAQPRRASRTTTRRALDRDLLDGCSRSTATGRVHRPRWTGSTTASRILSDPDEDPATLDEFAESRLESAERHRRHLHRAVLLRLRGRRPDERARVRRPAQPARRAPAGDVRVRHRALGRPRLPRRARRGVGARRGRPPRRRRLPARSRSSTQPGSSPWTGPTSSPGPSSRTRSPR